MFRLGRFVLVALVLPTCWWGTAVAGDGSGADQPMIPLLRSVPPDQPMVPPLRSVPDFRLSVSDMPGETTLRLPLSSESGLLYGLLSPYLSLGASTSLGMPWNSTSMPWNSTLPSSLRNDSQGPERDLRLGAGFALPLSDRAQLYGEYGFLRGRLDPGVGRGLLQREPDSADFRAGFSIRLN